jgi:segregation and condensation protein B
MLMRKEIKAAVEAILFVKGEWVALDELVEILEVPLLDLKEIVEELIMDYNKGKRGIQIAAFDKGYLMCTRPEYADIISRMQNTVKKRLSPASLETLAIIAYRQPITRSEIDNIRGVKSERVIAALLEKGLIEEAGHKAAPGQPILYVTSPEFLKVFGLTSLKDLPELREE